MNKNGNLPAWRKAENILRRFGFKFDTDLPNTEDYSYLTYKISDRHHVKGQPEWNVAVVSRRADQPLVIINGNEYPLEGLGGVAASANKKYI